MCFHHQFTFGRPGEAQRVVYTLGQNWGHASVGSFDLPSARNTETLASGQVTEQQDSRESTWCEYLLLLQPRLEESPFMFYLCLK